MTDNKTEQEAPQGAEFGMERLSAVFEASARRWELAVYPALFAFILLAAYGFYLVFSLTKDVHRVAIAVEKNLTVLADNMQEVSSNMHQLTSNVRTMTVSLEAINTKVSTLEPIRTNMDSMNKSMTSMTHATRGMQYDMHGMNRNTRPISFMNRFVPW